jgi:CubicO group peptidase (beta-lactamase class C family)
MEFSASRASLVIVSAFVIGFMTFVAIANPRDLATLADHPAADRSEPTHLSAATYADLVCDFKRNISHDGIWGALEDNTCGVTFHYNPESPGSPFNGTETGTTCCSYFEHLNKDNPNCTYAKGLSVVGGLSNSESPNVRINSCAVDDPDQVFEPIWSASKMVTSALIMKLEEEGKLDRHAPLSQYIDWWTTDKNDPRANVTLHHTLSMTSGFGQHNCVSNADYDANGGFGGPPDSKLFSGEDCVQRIYDESYGNFWTADGKPTLKSCSGISPVVSGGNPLSLTLADYSPLGDGPVDPTSPKRKDVLPGDYWCYNEAHWDLSVYVARKVTGKDTYQEVFEEYMAPQVGIDTSNCRWNWPSVDNVDGGGGLSCSTGDFGKFLGHYVAQKYISAEGTKEMEKQHAVFPEKIELPGTGQYITGYRYGMFVTPETELILDGGNDGTLAGFFRPADTKDDGYWFFIGRDGNHGATESPLYSYVIPQIRNLISSGGDGVHSDACPGVCPPNQN